MRTTYTFLRNVVLPPVSRYNALGEQICGCNLQYIHLDSKLLAHIVCFAKGTSMYYVIKIWGFQLFVLCSVSQIIGGDFAKFCRLLRIYELYQSQRVKSTLISLINKEPTLTDFEKFYLLQKKIPPPQNGFLINYTKTV